MLHVCVCYSWHGCVLLSDSTFVVHGGYNGNQALNDTFTFNTGQTHTHPASRHTHTPPEPGLQHCVCVADTNTWTELVHPQLSVPRAGHSIITMALANQNLSFKDDGKERNSDRTPKTLLVFGGGDNEGNFYSDLTTLVVAELLDQN